MNRHEWVAARIAAVAPVVAAALVLLPGSASADVQVAASRAESGARDVTLTFRVTNDDPAVPTTRLRVLLPTARPLLGVEPTAPPGWTARLTTAAPRAPDAADGTPAAEIVTAIEWEGGTLAGDDDVLFPVDVDRLPEGAGPLRFRAVQTFADGTTVEWSDEAPYGVPAPAHPSLIVPYAGTTALPAEPGHHHGRATAADRAIAGGGYWSGGWTLGLAAGVTAVVVAGVTALGRRQRRRLAAVWAAAPPTAGDRSVSEEPGVGTPAAGRARSTAG